MTWEVFIEYLQEKGSPGSLAKASTVSEGLFVVCIQNCKAGKNFVNGIDIWIQQVYDNCISWNDTVSTDNTVYLLQGGDSLIQINPTSNQPIFEQIISQVKMAVLKGYLKPGDSIPSVRKLALQLSVTPGTVAKAYNELEHQEVIVTIRGKGAYIAEKSDSKPSPSRVGKSFEAFREACVELIYMGIKKEEMIRELDEIFSSVSR